MFDIGFTELLLVAIIALIVLGPERLPHAVRTTAKWVSKIRSMFSQVKAQIEREIDADEVRQQIHNDAIMQQLNDSKKDINGNLDDIRSSLKNTEFDLQSSSRNDNSAALGNSATQADKHTEQQSTPDLASDDQSSKQPK